MKSKPPLTLLIEDASESDMMGLNTYRYLASRDDFFLISKEVLVRFSVPSFSKSWLVSPSLIYFRLFVKY